MEPKETRRDLPTTIQAEQAIGDLHDEGSVTAPRSPGASSASLATPVSPAEESAPPVDAQDTAPADAPPESELGAAPVRLGVIDYLNVVPVYDWILARERDEGGTPGIATVAGVPSQMNQALLAGEI